MNLFFLFKLTYNFLYELFFLQLALYNKEIAAMLRPNPTDPVDPKVLFNIISKLVNCNFVGVQSLYLI